VAIGNDDAGNEVALTVPTTAMVSRFDEGIDFGTGRVIDELGTRTSEVMDPRKHKRFKVLRCVTLACSAGHRCDGRCTGAKTMDSRYLESGAVC